MDMQRQYKKKAFGFGDAREGRLIRAEQHEQSRKDQRTKNFTKNRNLQDAASSPMLDAESENLLVQDRLNKLVKWKAERDRRRKLEQAHKKPVFKVGVVHHKFYSPVDKTVESKPSSRLCRPLSKQTPPLRRITRATQKRLLAKLDSNKTQVSTTSKTVNIETEKIPIVSLKKLTMAQVKLEHSFAPVNYEFKPPENLYVPVFGRVAMANISMDKYVLTSASDKVHNDINSEEKEYNVMEKLNAGVENFALHDTRDSSIEAVTLHLSSDDQDTANNSQEIEAQEKNRDSVGSNKENCSAPVTALPATPQEPVFFSPYVVSSRGKSSARKEQQLRLGIGSQGSNEIPTKDTVLKNLNISVEDEERTAQYFKFILSKETLRLTELCDKWSEVKSTSDITEDGQYLINQAIGQTTLLICKKFQRFQGLVEDCETGKGEMLVTCKDLQGFWDAMYMEIRNCDSRFDKLEKIRSNNWEEEKLNIVNHNIKKKARQKNSKEKKAPPTKPTTRSSIRNLISAARKKKIQQEQNMEHVTETNGISEASTSRKSLPTFVHAKDGNNSSTRHSISQRRSGSPQVYKKVTPAKLEKPRSSLLQRVQLSEASKQMRSPLTIMKISKMCKTPEVQLDETISYVNSGQTPGKSILKRSEKPVEDKCLNIKPSNKVNFDDHVVLNEVPIDEELQTKLNLSIALARIDSYDFDHSNVGIKINAERRLDFDNDSFDEEDDCVFLPDAENRSSMFAEQKASRMTAPEVKVSATPLTESNSMSPKRSIKHDQQKSPNTRVLRSRTVGMIDTPKIVNKLINGTKEDADQKENKNPTIERRKSLRKSSLRSVEEQQAEEDIDVVNVTSGKEIRGRRKSVRKSVRFNAEDCSGCQPIKLVLPVTPHSKRNMSSKLSLLGVAQKEDITPLSNGDLMSFDSPLKVPARVRRSSRKIN